MTAHNASLETLLLYIVAPSQYNRELETFIALYVQYSGLQICDIRNAKGNAIKVRSKVPARQ